MVEYIDGTNSDDIEVRHILLSTKCHNAGGGCCGKSTKTKYTILDIEKTNGEWEIIDYSITTSNILELNKKHGKWAGTVYSLELYKDDIFMEKLRSISKLLKPGCEVVAP